MKEIIGGKPIKTCPSCGVKFTFDSEDVKHDNEQYWAGLRWGYHNYLYDLRDTLPKKSMIDFGTAMINKRKNKRNRRK